MNWNYDDPIVEINNVVGEESANTYLNKGWIIVSASFGPTTNFDDPNQGTYNDFHYSFGRPRSVNKF
ncbi:hypothetical protein [Jeotgalibacillus terrae]|uniref:Uncharacterized protein n=1 Tax=Jeotgalibacillus terrae TaxID=587735 RepID=A0ABW5ZEJ5_9BACL|nr:hypothetical protein [Jeotgalibacillus terrae]MBM7580059.1 hypothetical protein [Jeotgalibacillus terrae]